ncbi:hypothetical protein TPL01_31750 [Sulfuriferula plumbiphila]|uniref:Uncharacterized protein n=1 Tax=Sulfuriferula plumbiphila TaxID=171865 RepID=A0A512LC21_9PROT|nr:hypothetical protein [Sulfuriferula plumbiphila]BBP04099.1 hypothetical protein SFPGR_15210 [Sulfuriferula plumbiphila]GEP32037.1 hypothetical protein TPL01_31750 [Sulfuriferula plumbiphila]
MSKLANSLRAWGTPDFNRVLKSEIEQLDASQLPLQQGLTIGSYALDNRLDVIVIGTAEEDGHIRAKIGIFYTSIIAGCSCADDPTPVDENNEYCVMQIEIDPTTAEAVLTLLTD